MILRIQITQIEIQYQAISQEQTQMQALVGFTILFELLPLYSDQVVLESSGIWLLTLQMSNCIGCLISNVSIKHSTVK